MRRQDYALSDESVWSPGARYNRRRYADSGPERWVHAGKDFVWSRRETKLEHGKGTPKALD